MAMMTVQNCAGVFVNDERFGVAAPSFGHIEKFIPVSWFDLFVHFQPVQGHEFDVFLGPRH